MSHVPPHADGAMTSFARARYCTYSQLGAARCVRSLLGRSLLSVALVDGNVPLTPYTQQKRLYIYTHVNVKDHKVTNTG